MSQIAHLGTRIQYQLVIVDDKGNTSAVECPPLGIAEPSAKAYQDAFRHFEEHRHQLQLQLEEQAAREKAASSEEKDGPSPPAPANRAERRRMARNGAKAEVAAGATEIPVTAGAEE